MHDERAIESDASARRRRGWILVAIAFAVSTAALGANWWASMTVERDARQVERQLRRILQTSTVPEILFPETDLPDEGELRGIQKEDNGASMTVEVNRLWQLRCITGHLRTDGSSSIKTAKCDFR